MPCTSAQVNNSGQKPYLGWSNFSQQTIQGDFLTQANMITQSGALKASGLQEHGFVYINLDSGWQGGFDQNGRPIPNSTTFPDIKALVDHIHANGQKAGIYWIPGIEQPAVDGNYPILGTPYHTRELVHRTGAPQEKKDGLRMTDRLVPGSVQRFFNLNLQHPSTVVFKASFPSLFL